MDLKLQTFDRRFLAGIGSTVALGTVMVVLTVVVLVWLLRVMVLRPLTEVVSSSQRIVEGDLEARARVRGEGEFAHLAWQVNRMTDHLAETLREVNLKREELQTILDAIDDEVVVLDESRRVVTANVAYRKNLSASASEVVGSLCGDQPGTGWPCEGDQPSGCPVTKVFKTGKLEKGIVSYTDAAGVNRVVEIHASPLVEAGGTVRQVVEVRRDISERRKMEAILAHSEHLASLGLLASGLSHEINNPLGAIATSVEGLRRRLPDDPEVVGEARERLDQVLARIAAEVDRCRTITNRLLKIARPSERVRNLVDINHVIEEVIALLAHDIRRAGIDVNLDLEPQLPVYRGDETQIVQIIMNLSMNAVQAMSEEGGRLRIATQKESERITITVQDSGDGIPPDVQGRLFEPFFTTKPAGKGTGLGLFITHQIVTGLGGSINVRSETGEGATVAIELPLTDGPRE